MNNKLVGAVFCLVSAILMSARYIAAAVLMSSAQSWSSELFQAGLSYVGSPLKIASIASLVVGIVFIGCGIYRDVKDRSVR